MKDAKADYPVTAGVRLLRDKGVAFKPHLYQYIDKGGTQTAAKALGVPEHAVIKTLVMESDTRQPMLVLMHGDREVSTKALARQVGVKSVAPCSEAAVQKYTGYMVGGVSPFGTRAKLPVYVESTILQLPGVYINGGKRGFLVEIDPAELWRVLSAVEVQVAIESE